MNLEREREREQTMRQRYEGTKKPYVVHVNETNLHVVQVIETFAVCLFRADLTENFRDRVVRHVRESGADVVGRVGVVVREVRVVVKVIGERCGRGEVDG